MQTWRISQGIGHLDPVYAMLVVICGSLRGIEMTTSAPGSGNPCVTKTEIEYVLFGAFIAPCGSYGHHCGVSVAERGAAGVPGAQDCRGDRRRPAARRPQHFSDDPENRTPPALECAAASSGIDYGGIKYKAEQDRSRAALCRTTSIRGTDSLLERAGFEPPVPRGLL
jgi:hypothetical protein